MGLFGVCIIGDDNLDLFQFLVHSQRFSLHAHVDFLQKVGIKLDVRAVHSFGKLGKLRQRHFLDYLRIVQIALQHHE